MPLLNDQITEAAQALGFVLTGFASVAPLEREAFFRKWLSDGRQGDMSYLARDPQRRFDPRLLDPRIASVITLAYPYPAAHPPDVDWRRELRGRIASYAFGADYHDVVLGKASMVADQLKQHRTDAFTRVYVDTGPVLEREWAMRAAVGWFGKNTNLLNRDHGSYFFLAEIFTDIEIESDRPAYGDYCGTCRRCLDLCPTGALTENYLIEPRICISYLTIELRGPIPIDLRPKIGNWIFGCDICQEVCPWNETGDASVDSQLVPYLPELMAMDDDGFRALYGKSAIRRAKRRGLLRNVAVALGNSGNPDALASLEYAIENDKESLVRAHAAWAIGNIGGSRARETLANQLKRENETEVASEIKLALARL